MSFPCTQCGECCRRTKFAPDEFLQAVGIERVPTGACKHFVENTCRIYETRPTICRIPLERYRENAALCNRWMLETGNTNLITEAQLKSAGA